MEEWKQIPVFIDYQVSNLGQVKNKHGKLLNPWMNGTPAYLKVSIMPPKICGLRWQERQKVIAVHRLVLMAFVGMPNGRKLACHKNDVKTDNRLENLYWGTHSDNAKDSIRNGTFRFTSPGFGEHHHGVKFSDELIAKIKSEYTGKHGEQTILAKKYNMCQQHISAIVLGKLRKRTTEEVYH